MCRPHVHGAAVPKKWRFLSRFSISQPLQATDFQQQQHYPGCQLRASRQPKNVPIEQITFGIFK
jgi:hypothetical protein